MVSNKGIVIRHMALTDLPAVCLIEEAAQTFPWSKKALYDCYKFGYASYVLTVDQRVVAFIVFRNVVDETHVLNFCVHPKHQSQGHGKKLLAHVLQVAKLKYHAIQVFLEVRSSNEIAINLYRQFGFEKIGIRKAYYASYQGREDAIMLRFDLV